MALLLVEIDNVLKRGRNVRVSNLTKKHIGRNPRFDREGHWAEIGNIGQTYGTLGRY